MSELSFEEESLISDFLNNLTVEKRTFTYDIDVILNSVIFEKKFIDNKLVGLAGIYRKKLIPIFFIVVKEGYQGKGIGRELMDNLYQTLVYRNYNYVVLSVFTFNPRAIEIYKKQGYEVVGINNKKVYMVLSLTKLGVIIKYLFKILLRLKGGA